MSWSLLWQLCCARHRYQTFAAKALAGVQYVQQRHVSNKQTYAAVVDSLLSIYTNLYDFTRPLADATLLRLWSWWHRTFRTDEMCCRTQLLTHWNRMLNTHWMQRVHVVTACDGSQLSLCVHNSQSCGVVFTCCILYLQSAQTCNSVATSKQRCTCMLLHFRSVACQTAWVRCMLQWQIRGARSDCQAQQDECDTLGQKEVVEMAWQIAAVLLSYLIAINRANFIC